MKEPTPKFTASTEATALAKKIAALPVLRIIANEQAVAELIDAELQLPQRNAALLIVQTMVDVEANLTPLGLTEMIAELREALTRIKK